MSVRHSMNRRNYLKAMAAATSGGDTDIVGRGGSSCNSLQYSILGQRRARTAATSVSVSDRCRRGVHYREIRSRNELDRDVCSRGAPDGLSAPL
jgi:hypothetical protein